MGLITSFPGGNGGSEITVDSELSTTSENPVQNKVITTELNKKANSSSIPTQLSQLTGDSTHRTVTDTEKSAWNGKQNALTAGNGIDITNNVISAGIPIVANQFDKANIYSTTEKVVGMWTDGRPLYQKVINCGALPTSTEGTKTIPHNIVNADLIFLARGAAFKSDGKSINLPIVGKYDSTENVNPIEYQVAVNVDRTSITYSIGNNRGLSSYINSYVVLQYTKTTDAANSFKYADENDYSTTEHIVGTWIDGKPLYQKTINWGTVSSPGATKAHGISNLKQVIKIDGTWVVGTEKGSLPYAGATDNFTMEINGSNLVADMTSGFNGVTDVYVILKYTKTTD